MPISLTTPVNMRALKPQSVSSLVIYRFDVDVLRERIDCYIGFLEGASLWQIPGVFRIENVVEAKTETIGDYTFNINPGNYWDNAKVRVTGGVDDYNRIKKSLYLALQDKYGDLAGAIV